jgi:hypothetical protein
MPVNPVTDTEDTSEKAESAAEDVARAIVQHAAAVRTLRAQRKRGPKARSPALTTRIEVQIDPEEIPEEIAREAADAIMKVIENDAAGEQWSGFVDLLGDNTRFGKARVIASVGVELDGEHVPSPAVAKARAESDSMAAQAKTIEGLGAALVKVANAKASDAEAMAKIFATLGDVHRSDRKWDYKMEKERQETEREEIKERAATTRAKARWDAFETLLEEYKDVAEIWSKWFTMHHKPGDKMKPPPSPPTKAEIDAVFVDERFEMKVTLDNGEEHSVRATVAEMLVEPDRRRRVLLAQRLAKVLNHLPKDVQAALKARMLEVLGMERAIELAAWLSLPVS